jgi:hypothetical protein
MAIDLRTHFVEGTIFMTKHYSMSKNQRREHKIQLWNQFVDSGLIGITEEDCGIVPRVLPLSYFKEIKSTAYLVSLFAMRLLSLPAKEVRAIIPAGPIRDFLMDELEVLKYRPDRLVGSFRFDMATVGEPVKGNPPKLLEINEIGFGGLTRTSFIQNTMMALMPELKKNAFVPDPAVAELQNFLRLGRSMARLQYDAYDWEEQVLLQGAITKGVAITLVSPKQLKFIFDSADYPLMKILEVGLRQGRIVVGKDWKPEMLQMGYSFELQDYLRDPEMYQNIVRSKTPQYSPFLTGLVASKAILVLLNDRGLRKKLLGSGRALETAILGASFLEGNRHEVEDNYRSYVLKHADGLGGEKVFFDRELLRRLKTIAKQEESEWVVQERTKLNVIEIEGTLSKKRKVIADLGVFVQYDWSQGKFNHFEVGGFITRATNKTFKVNVSSGGLQLPVFFDKAS